MEKLISKRELAQRMYENVYYTEKAIHQDGCWIRYRDFEDELENCPTVEERPKGKWARVISQNGWLTTTTYQCNKCAGEPRYKDSIYEYEYCPYCGARMESE